MRLDKFVAKSTELSQCDLLRCIQRGEVSVNGEVVTKAAQQVHENNQICLKGVRLQPRPFRYLLMHKPAGTICSNIDEAYPSLFTGLEIDKCSELHIAGRLDADTTGLVLITDDGRWSFDITRPSKACHKVYRVCLSQALSGERAKEISEQFEHGIMLQGESRLTLPATLQVITPTEVLLTLTEGKFHQVKRMFAAMGNRVVALHREQIGAVYLDVEVGHWRYLTHQEVQSFLSI
ncbi:MAG: pseudouridine synthase [Marinomonas sp.]